LPSYAPEGASLEAAPIDMNQIIGESTLRGALGSIPLAPTYEGLLAATQPRIEDPLVFRGLRGEAADPLAHWRDPRVQRLIPDVPIGPNYGTSNPYSAASYGRLGGAYPGSGKVYPIRLGQEAVQEVGKDAILGMPSGQRSSWLRGEVSDARPPRGTVWTHGEMVNPRSSFWDSAGEVDLNRFHMDPSRQYNWAEGTRSYLSGEPLGEAELSQLWRDSAERLGLDVDNQPLMRGAGEPEIRQRILQEIARDPKFRTPLPQRAVGAIKSAGKGLLKGLTPAALLEGALLAGPISGLAGGAGYASAAPQSSGLFTPPGPGYEGLVTAEDIIAAAEAKEALKEQERQRLLEQYRATGYDLDPSTRLLDLR